MKKTILIVVAWVLAGAGVAYGQKALTVSSGSGFPDDIVAIDVNLNDGSGIGGIQFELNYDSGLLSLWDSDGDGDLNEEVARGTLLSSSHTLTVNTSTPGRVAAIAVGVTSMNSGPGSVIHLNFQISGTAPVTTTPLTLSNLVASDPLGLSVPISGNGGIMTIDGVSGNNPPTAVPDNVTTDEDVSIDISVLLNDDDPDGDALKVTQASGAAHGSVSLLGDQVVRYTPNLNYHGTDSFSYSISDGRGGSDQTQVTVTVNPVNDEPNAVDDKAVTSEGAQVIIPVLANDTDADGDDLSVVEVGTATYGSADLNGDDTITYTPGPGFQTSDSFTYRIGDGQGGEDTALVTVTSTVNQPPEAHDDSGVTTVGKPVVINVVSNDSDPDNDPLTVLRVSQATNGSAEVYNTTSVRYSPAAGFDGNDSFEYTVSDGLAESTATVRIRVSRAQQSATLFFPASLKTGNPLFSDSFVGVAVLNPSFGDETLSLSMLDPEGIEIQSLQLGQPVPAFGQTSFLTDEFFEINPAASLLRVQGEDTIQGFFLTGDYRLSRLDGVGATAEGARRLFFPILRENASEVTLLYLTNESEQESSSIEITVFNHEGVLIGEASGALLPQGSIVGTISDILGEEVVLNEGFVQVVSNKDIKGFELLASESTFSALAGRFPTAVRTLWAPQFFVDSASDGTSILRLLNTDDRVASVILRAFNDESELLASETFDISPSELWVGDLSTVFDLDSPGLVSGFLKLSISDTVGASSRVIGAITYKGFAGQTSTTLPLVEEGSTEFIFPHLAQAGDGSIYTGFSILNPGEEMAVVNVEAFRPNGLLSKRKVLEVAPGTRAIDLLRSEAFFGEDFEQIEGHIRMSSTAEVVVFAVFGDSEGNFQSAIEGQPRLRK